MTEEKVLWVAYTNTDLTEGRGAQVAKYYCETEITAKRLAKHIGPMGSDGYVGQLKLLVHEGKWYVPYGVVKVETPSKEDVKNQALADARASALSRAKALGLTDEEIKALQ